MAERVRNFQISDRAKLGIAGTLAVFVAAFLGATVALALDGDDHGDGRGPEFGLAAAAHMGGPSGEMPGLPGQSQGGVPTPLGGPQGAVPSLPGDSQGGLPTPPAGQGQGAPPQLPAIPNNPGSGQSNGNSGKSSQGNSNQ